MSVVKPQHVAIIMDGNGRWAVQKRLPRVAGHRAGVKRVREIIEYSHDNQIEYLTLFAFGQENWRRPQDEVSFLMSLLLKSLTREFKNLHAKNVRVRVIGERCQYNEALTKAIEETETLTANNTGLKLNIAINYSGRWDILNAVQRLCQQGIIDPTSINEDMFTNALSTRDLPEPDLLIRTSGELRISNFFLWQMAYTEMYFTDILWPDFSIAAYAEAIDDFAKRQRRFGKTGQQIDSSDPLAC